MEKQTGNERGLLLLSCLIGGGGACLVSILIMIVLAWLINRGLIGEQWLRAGPYAACLVGGLAGGSYSVRSARVRPLLLGVGTGLCFCGIVAGMKLWLPSFSEGEQQLHFPALLGVVGGLLSSIFYASRKKERK